ncbi:MAG: NADH-quinone oxidoreductase subunit NuoE [Hyphomicrobiales bacterium]
MSVRRLAPPSVQPRDFAFTAQNSAWAEGQIAKYPAGRQASAVIPLLWKAQEQAGGWVPRKAIEEVAAMLDLPFIRVMEIATFYTMFNLSPIGRHHVQLCGTVPCHVCGALELKEVCEQRIGPQGTVSADGQFSWIEVECLGACCNAPMVQIGYDYYEDLDADRFGRLLDDLAAGRPVKTGSQTGRTGSEPVGGGTTLTDPALFDGSQIGAWKKRFDEEAAKADQQKPSGAKTSDAKPAGTPSTMAASSGPAVPGEGGKVHVPQPASPMGLSVAPAGSPIANAVPADEPGADHAPGEPAAAHAEQEAIARREEAEIAAKLATLPKHASSLDKANAVGEKPKGLAAARDGAPDDLQRIKGIGRVNEGRLHALGMFHFDQIAHWTRAEIRWVGTYLAFPGRIDREDWTGQAKILAAGGDLGKKASEPRPAKR